MVRRAVDLVGGMEAFVPDTARRVAIKPNVTIPDSSGSGIVTDARVVRAVALLVHEAAPGARISIAEGAGGWMSPALKDSTDQEYRLEDGFEIAGHRATVRELRQRGVDIECVDLNFDRPVRMAPRGGGLADSDYDIAATIVEADAWINCPVAKTHGAKITAAMKNHLGILPGTHLRLEQGQRHRPPARGHPPRPARAGRMLGRPVGPDRGRPERGRHDRRQRGRRLRRHSPARQHDRRRCRPGGHRPRGGPAHGLQPGRFRVRRPGLAAGPGTGGVREHPRPRRRRGVPGHALRQGGHRLRQRRLGGAGQLRHGPPALDPSRSAGPGSPVHRRRGGRAAPRARPRRLVRGDLVRP